MKNWQKKELRDKKRREYRESRISSDHELSGAKHREPRRDKDIPLKWSEGNDGKLHVEPSRVAVGPRPGFRIDADDWIRIFGTEEEKAKLESQEE